MTSPAKNKWFAVTACFEACRLLAIALCGLGRACWSLIRGSPDRALCLTFHNYVLPRAQMWCIAYTEQANTVKTNAFPLLRRNVFVFTGSCILAYFYMPRMCSAV